MKKSCRTRYGTSVTNIKSLTKCIGEISVSDQSEQRRPTSMELLLSITVCLLLLTSLTTKAARWNRLFFVEPLALVSRGEIGRTMNDLRDKW